jgi:glyoxylase-like metal-dependent hydrolase (beta-lactamase superfamily II)
MIKPTVGRVVHFYPESNDSMLYRGGDTPLAAIITHVHSDYCVNLAVFSAEGYALARTSVRLVHDARPRSGSQFCEWMPYQKGQAAKTEELEALLMK